MPRGLLMNADQVKDWRAAICPAPAVEHTSCLHGKAAVTSSGRDNKDVDPNVLSGLCNVNLEIFQEPSLKSRSQLLVGSWAGFTAREFKPFNSY